jgi:hypothetical protein
MQRGWGMKCSAKVKNEWSCTSPLPYVFVVHIGATLQSYESLVSRVLKIITPEKEVEFVTSSTPCEVTNCIAC